MLGKRQAVQIRARVLLVTPPLVQPNTPYSATPMLTGFLRGKGVDARQADASLELVLRLFSRGGVGRIADAVRSACRKSPALRRNPSVAFFLRNAVRCREAIGPAIRYLQGHALGLAPSIAGRDLCPEGPRFATLRQGGGFDSGGVFDGLTVQERARHVASLFLDDLADVIRVAVDPGFAFSRYEERLAAVVPEFGEIRTALDAAPTLVTEHIRRLTQSLLRKHRPAVVCFTIPFPGALMGALRMSGEIRRRSPGTAIVLGGGYVSTELRDLTEPALFDLVDYVILDDGPAPLIRLLKHLEGTIPRRRLMRTFSREEGRVVFHDAGGCDVPHGRTDVPTWDGLPMNRYLSVMEMPNPAHSLWSDGRWNKIMLAAGCYWRRCKFCDTTLPYIRRFDPAPVQVLVRRIRSAIAETGHSGFHFVDEAIPPGLAGRLSEALIRGGVSATWWGNIRFENAFTDERVSWMKQAGCLAVTGGLETVCNRTLAVMNKGIRVESAIRVITRFARAGVLVHAYLMYGFPGQTVRETMDALETVRQLFASGLVQSAYWHRFALTVHSEMGADSAAFGIAVGPAGRGGFARNEVPILRGVDPRVVDMGPGLHKAVYNFMHGLGLDEDVRAWFDVPVPRPGRRIRNLMERI